MQRNRNSIYAVFLGCCLVNSSYGMGLRSFVALPVEKKGAVMRIAFEHENKADSDKLSASAAYGLSASQTLLLGLPYRISPAGDSRQGDLSVLYRHIVWRRDQLVGTDRLGLLGGIIAPTDRDRDVAIQAGFVFSHFKNRHEIDIDVLYQAGINSRGDSGRYDISWQYRLFPAERPDWGLTQEINGVMEVNGRWQEGNAVTHQATLGWQWIHPKLVLEGGVAKDLNNHKETRYILSTRFHFN